MNKFEYIYIELLARKCFIEVFINGLPLATKNTLISPGYLSYPLNEYLLSNNNLLINIYPDRKQLLNENYSSDEILHFKNLFEIDGSIKKYFDGGIAAPDEGEKLFEFNKDDLSNSIPFSFEQKFDFSSFNFDNTFNNLPIIEDENSLRNYGIYIIDLLKQKNIEELLFEFTIKIRDNSIAHNQSPLKTIENFYQLLENRVLPNKPFTDVSQDKIELTKYLEGRVYEIKIKDKESLIITQPDEKGSIIKLDVFVALIDGDLKIVR